MSTGSYWLEGRQPRSPSLKGDHQADVVLIGAGVAGASAALALADSGVSTVWLEAGTVSIGASGRNAGFVLQGTCERYSRAAAIMGHERARAVHTLSRQNHQAMVEAIDRFGIDCGYQRRGSLQLAESPSEERDLTESAALLNADGFVAQELSGDQLPAWCAEAGFRHGVFLPDDGELDPAAFVSGVADAAVAGGVRLFERSPVLEVSAPEAGDAYVRTPDGSVRASLVLACTNAWAGELFPWFRDLVSPVRGQMLATAAVPPLFHCPVYADHGFDYWRQDRHGVIVLGGWRNLDPHAEVGIEDRLHPEIQDSMTAFIHRFSALRGVEITHRWAGTMGFSRDGQPIVGSVPGSPGALAAVGFTGHGFGFAWLCGRALVELANHGQSEVATLFSSRRLIV